MIVEAADQQRFQQADAAASSSKHLLWQIAKFGTSLGESTCE